MSQTWEPHVGCSNFMGGQIRCPHWATWAPCPPRSPYTQDCSGRQNKVSIRWGFWPNPGPGRLPSDSDRRDDEFASVFAAVAFLTVSFVPKSIFWNLAETKSKNVVPSKTGYTYLVCFCICLLMFMCFSIFLAMLPCSNVSTQ